MKCWGLEIISNKHPEIAPSKVGPSQWIQSSCSWPPYYASSWDWRILKRQLVSVNYILSIAGDNKRLMGVPLLLEWRKTCLNDGLGRKKNVMGIHPLWTWLDFKQLGASEFWKVIPNMSCIEHRAWTVDRERPGLHLNSKKDVPIFFFNSTYNL